MASKIVQKIKDKVEYEKESWRMSQEELRQIMRDHPERFGKGGKR